MARSIVGIIVNAGGNIFFKIKFPKCFFLTRICNLKRRCVFVPAVLPMISGDHQTSHQLLRGTWGCVNSVIFYRSRLMGQSRRKLVD